MFIVYFIVHETARYTGLGHYHLRADVIDAEMAHRVLVSASESIWLVPGTWED